MKILLVSLNSKYIHTSLGIYYLKAYADAVCSHLGYEIIVREYTVNDYANTILQSIYDINADIVGFSCYIWDIELVERICLCLRQISSCTTIIGGPEVSFDNDYPFADYVIQGEGEQGFAHLLNSLANGEKPDKYIVSKPVCELSGLPSPYTDCYFASFEGSIANKLIYYEASRGCPFECSFCLSSQADGVRHFPIERVKTELNLLIERGAKCIKFVDRTFNSNLPIAKQILRFIAELSALCGCVFHFELSPAIFDDELFDIISSLPQGRVQFEIGVQSVHDETLQAVSRHIKQEISMRNIMRLIGFRNANIHLDLIAGLPHDTYDTFTHAVNVCLAMHPDVLQVGFLKMLKGSRIRAEYDKYNYRFDSCAPYEVLANDTLSYDELCRIRHIESAVDKYYNSGLFNNTLSIVNTANPAEFFERLGNKTSANTTLRASYVTLLEHCICSGIDRESVYHNIKLDILSHDPNCRLPDGISSHRRHDIEKQYRQILSTSNIRAEYFEFDDKVRVFNYDKKVRFPSSFEVIEVN